MNLNKNSRLISSFVKPATRKRAFLCWNKLKTCSSNISVYTASQNEHRESNLIESREKNKLQRRTLLFDEAKKQQLADRVPRIEKIEVKYKGRVLTDDAIMFMNKNLSTPYHCAMQIHKLNWYQRLACLCCIYNSKWDIHSPLPFDCELELLKFTMNNSLQWQHEQVNKAYWRTCSVILGAVVQEAFKENQKIGLLKIPEISVKSGAFCYDLLLDPGMRDWEAREEDLVFMSKVARRIISKNLKFEKLEMEAGIATEIFQEEEQKLNTIAELLEKNGQDSSIPVYRFGEYMDVIEGPLISNTSHIFHYIVTALHQVSKETNTWRIQGLSLPEELKLHHSVWSVLENRARKLVREDLPENCDLGVDNSKRFNMHRYESIENKTKIRSKATGQWLHKDWKTSAEKIDPTVSN
uniref:Large ribosomal subunit protein mL39 n=1 Tax=Ciona intestinalis TaxID=7719 RepID=F6SNK4_CIOIN